MGTPDRFARWWAEFIDYDPGTTDTTFPSIQRGQMVCVSHIRVWSLCEHHLLPFSCDISVGYLAADRVLGLSKIARVAHRAAHRLQVQERLVAQIGQDIIELSGSTDVAVLAQGEHLCMIMRGVRTEGRMASSYFSGRLEREPFLRSEFLELVQTQK